MLEIEMLFSFSALVLSSSVITWRMISKLNREVGEIKITVKDMQKRRFR